MRSIAVLRALPDVGGILCGVPALRALRGAYPDARIAYVGLERTGPLLARFDHYIDELLPFPGWPGLPGELFEPVRAEAFLDAVRKRGFDLALQLQDGSAASARFAHELGAARVEGLGPGDGEDGGSEVRRLLRVVERLGVAPRGEHLELPVDDDDRREAERARPDAPYACLHGGGAAGLAEALTARGLVPVDAGASDVSLGGLGVLLAGAWVTVTDDPDTARVAEAVGAPHVFLPRQGAVEDVLREVDALLQPGQLDRRAAVHHHV